MKAMNDERYVKDPMMKDRAKTTRLDGDDQSKGLNEQHREKLNNLKVQIIEDVKQLNKDFN